MFPMFLKSHNSFKYFHTIQHTLSNLNLQRLAMSGTVMNRFWVPVLWSTGYLFLVKRGQVKCKDAKMEVEKFQTRRDNMKLETVSE